MFKKWIVQKPKTIQEELKSWEIIWKIVKGKNKYWETSLQTNWTQPPPSAPWIEYSCVVNYVPLLLTFSIKMKVPLFTAIENLCSICNYLVLNGHQTFYLLPITYYFDGREKGVKRVELVEGCPRMKCLRPSYTRTNFCFPSIAMNSRH